MPAQRDGFIITYPHRGGSVRRELVDNPASRYSVLILDGSVSSDQLVEKAIKQKDVHVVPSGPEAWSEVEKILEVVNAAVACREVARRGRGHLTSALQDLFRAVDRL